jgi:regulator of replication initiation timing
MTAFDLTAWLEQNPAAAARLTLEHGQVTALRDELHRLLQSNDRLRKQNRKLRQRIERVKARSGAADGDAADGGADDGGADDGGADDGGADDGDTGHDATSPVVADDDR